MYNLYPVSSPCKAVVKVLHSWQNTEQLKEKVGAHERCHISFIKQWIYLCENKRLISVRLVFFYKKVCVCEEELGKFFQFHSK